MHSLGHRITTPWTARVSRIRASPVAPAPCRYRALCLMFGPRLLQTSLTSLMIVGLPLIHRLGNQTPLPRARPTRVPAEPASALSHDSSGIQTGSTPLGHSIRPPWASSRALGAPMWCTIRRPEPSTCVAWPASPYREAINLVPRMRKPAPSFSHYSMPGGSSIPITRIRRSRTPFPRCMAGINLGIPRPPEHPSPINSPRSGWRSAL